MWWQAVYSVVPAVSCFERNIILVYKRNQAPHVIEMELRGVQVFLFPGRRGTDSGAKTLKLALYVHVWCVQHVIQPGKSATVRSIGWSGVAIGVCINDVCDTGFGQVSDHGA